MRTQCPLYPGTFYTYSIDLSDETYNLTFRYSKRSDACLMDVEDAEENMIIRGMKLVPIYAMNLQYSLEKPEGLFFLVPKENYTLASSGVPNPKELYKTHTLIYDDLRG